MTRTLHLSVCAAVFATAAAAQQSGGSPAAANSQAPLVRSGAEEVVLDVVVRDKHGKSVNDLKPADFQIFDDGEKRTIKSFRLVQGEETVSTGGERKKLDPLRQIRLVTIIFERLDLNGRKLAREAALDLIKGELPQNVFMAVMAIDHRLEALQSFTNDRALLKKAIDRGTSGDSTDYTTDSAQIKSQLERMVGPNSSGAASLTEQVNGMSTGATGTSGASAAPDGAQMANLLMAQMMLQMLDSERAMAMMDQGRTSIYALLDAVKEQYRLPGRKTILYFSPGFSVPQGMEQPFRNVISIANRSNVSFYAVDARGLTTEGQNSQSISDLSAAADSSRKQAQSTGYQAVTSDQVKVFDKAIESSRANTQNTLATIADSTGGFLIANTNDFKSPLRRLYEDIETYYEITYNPEIQKYDGSFRKILAKTDHSEYKVQSRSGYFALPPSMVAKGNVVSGFEVPLLKALEETSLPHGFDYHAEGMHFRGLQNQSIAEIVLDVPLANVTLLEDKVAGVHEGRLAYVALIKTPSGEIVRKFQNEIPLKVASAKVEAFKQSHFIYSDHLEVPPGNYILATAVMDQQGQKISARKSLFNVPAVKPAVGISSVSVVRGLKDKEASTAPGDPMLMETKVVTPSITPLVKKSAEGLPFYMVVYPDKSNPAEQQLVMEFSKDGKVLGSGSPPLGKPDQYGRIQYVATAPVAQLEPGNYTIRFIVKQGSETAAESVSFTLQ